MLWQELSELAPIDQHLEKEHQEKTKVKNIQVPQIQGNVKCLHPSYSVKRLRHLACLVWTGCAMRCLCST